METGEAKMDDVQCNNMIIIFPFLCLIFVCMECLDERRMCVICNNNNG